MGGNVDVPKDLWNRLRAIRKTRWRFVASNAQQGSEHTYR